MTLAILIIILLSILAVPLSLKKLIDQSKKTGREDVLPGFDLSAEGEHRVVLESPAGYGIEVDEAVPEDGERIVIAMHGFSGSKASKAITLLQRIVTGRGTGLVKFDWPAHGRSRSRDADLTVTNCLRDLGTVVQHIKRKYPDRKLIAFATSFGGYIVMLYAAEHPDTFSKIILRSPALRFGWLLHERVIDGDLQRQLDEEGYFETGFDRMIKVSRELVEEADRYRLEDIYPGLGQEDAADDGKSEAAGEQSDTSGEQPDTSGGQPDTSGEQFDTAGEQPDIADLLSRVTIIHGDADELVPYEDSLAFAEANDIELYTVSGADHRYTGEGMLEEAVAFAAGKID